MKQNSVGQDIAEPGKADAQTEIQDVGTTTVPTNVVVPEHVATHPRYSAWCLDYQMKFDRQPFTTPELTEQDKSDFELWADSDSKATAMLEQTISKAMEHPLWKEYCVDAINNGAEGQLYNGGGLADVEDVEAEVEAWNDFLKKKEIAPEQDKSRRVMIQWLQLLQLLLLLWLLLLRNHIFVLKMIHKCLLLVREFQFPLRHRYLD